MKILYHHTGQGALYILDDDGRFVAVRYYNNEKMEQEIHCHVHELADCPHKEAVAQYRQEVAREFLIDHGIPVKPL